jgi:hypothetical protein
MRLPIKSNLPDSIPTFLVHEFVDLLLPFMTVMANASLAQGRLLTSQKHAVVSPLLKEAGLDAEDAVNFRRVSNLTFMSKVVEHAVADQITDYVNLDSLLGPVGRVCLDITDSSSFDPSFAQCRLTPLKPSSRLSSTVAWIIIMRC